MNIDILKEENDLCWEVFFQGLESPCEEMVQEIVVGKGNNPKGSKYEQIKKK